MNTKKDLIFRCIYDLRYNFILTNAKTIVYYIINNPHTILTEKDKYVASMGIDDYKADLDGDNINNLMKINKISYIEASTKYYSLISNDLSQRDKMFVENNGGIDHLIADLYDCSLHSNPIESYLNKQSSDEKLEYLKTHNHTAYKFLMNLKDGNGEFDEYKE